ncbi:minor capsid protein [Capybara microvirus Cap3_SP_188]|nr:minor capsid protein [Capybara microvirus Cap3_SP_188]
MSISSAWNNFTSGVKSWFSHAGDTLGGLLNTTDNILNDLPNGVENVYNVLSGQSHLTDAYQAQMLREDTAYQRAAQDMQAAGLSKFGGVSQAASSSSASYGQNKNLLSEGMTFISGLLSMEKAQADIDKTKAETESVTNENSTFYEKFHLDQLLKQSQLDLNKANVDIAKINGTYLADKITAEIQYMASQSAFNFAHTQNMVLQNKYYGQKVEADISNIESSTLLNKGKYTNTKASTEFILSQAQHEAEKIANTIAQREQINAQTLKIIEDTAYTQLLYNSKVYDLQYSIDAGLRTTDSPSRVLGVNVSQLAQTAVDSLMLGKNKKTGYFTFR